MTHFNVTTHNPCVLLKFLQLICSYRFSHIRQFCRRGLISRRDSRSLTCDIVHASSQGSRNRAARGSTNLPRSEAWAGPATPAPPGSSTVKRGWPAAVTSSRTERPARSSEGHSFCKSGEGGAPWYFSSLGNNAVMCS